MTTTYVSYQIIARDIDRSIERVAEQPNVARETEYYLSRIGEIKSIDDFMADSRVYNYALKAHGLEDMAYAKALIRKALTEGIDSEDALANKFTDNRYRDLVETFNFARHEETTTVFTRAQQGTVDRYLRQSLEEQAGSDDTGVRLALYFERNAASIDSAYSILADDALAKVVRTALGIPIEVAATDIDRQAAYLESRLDLEDFKDPEKVGEFLERFTALWELENGASGVDSSALLGRSSGFGISPDLLLRLNSLKPGGL